MKRICVFCGSSDGHDPRYGEAAVQLGHAMARRGIGLVYGGAGIGLMGQIANALLTAEGEAIGVIPKLLCRREVVHTQLSNMHVVDSMHERKAKMAELADAFIALPGGIGTLEELFEVWTWGQLGIHQKAIGILNVTGYYNPLLQFMDDMVNRGFLRPLYRDMLFIESDPDALLERMAQHHAPVLPKWLGLESI